MVNRGSAKTAKLVFPPINAGPTSDAAFKYVIFTSLFKSIPFFDKIKLRTKSGVSPLPKVYISFPFNSSNPFISPVLAK